MKQYLKTATALALGAVMFTACTSTETTPVPTTPEPAAIGMAFSARYVVPLTTGRENGEKELLDEKRAMETNVAELKPAFDEVLAGVLAGTIATYPDEDPIKPDASKDFCLKRIAKMKENGGTIVKPEDMTAVFEVTFDGHTEKGRSILNVKWVDVIFVDPTATIPDYVMGRILAADLKSVMVQKAGQSVALPDYLNQGAFERYVIAVESEKGLKMIAKYPDSRDIQQKIDQGQVADIEFIK